MNISYGIYNEIPTCTTDSNYSASTSKISTDSGADSASGTSYNLNITKGSLLNLTHNSTDALQIVVKGNTISIVWYCKIDGDDLDKKIGGSTYRQEIESAIESKWSGTYGIFGVSTQVTTDVIVLNDGKKHNVDKNQKYGEVHFHYSKGRSEMNTYKRDNQWSKDNPGYIDIYAGYDDWYSKSYFDLVIAHEFGHILGIKDGYYDKKTKTRAETDWINSIMCDQFGEKNNLLPYIRKPTYKDIMKALYAYKLNTWSYWSQADV